MPRHISLILAMVLALAVAPRADVWNFDNSHTALGFQVKHLVVTKVNGKFNDFSGHIEFDGKNLEKGSVEITIQVVSIDTDNEKRDNHLRSADFFDAEKFPTITFKSKKIIKGEGNKFQVIGDLTIKDVTKEVVIDAELNGIVTGPMGNIRAGFSASARINRHDFNVAWNNKLQDGTFIVGEEVKISIEAEVIKAK